MVIKEKGKFMVLIGEVARGRFELRIMGELVVKTEEGLSMLAEEIGWFRVTGGGGRRRPKVTGESWGSGLQLTEKSERERECIGNRFFIFYFFNRWGS